MDVATHHTVEELQGFLRRESNVVVFKRLQCVLAALKGQTGAEIAQVLSVSARTVRRLVKRYNEEGIEGMKTQPGQGRKGPLLPEQIQDFRNRVENGPTHQDQVCTLRGKDYQRILQEEFGVIRSLNSIYQLLHGLGYESLKPRPQHAQADEEAQQEFKKNSPKK